MRAMPAVVQRSRYGASTRAWWRARSSSAGLIAAACLAVAGCAGGSGHNGAGQGGDRASGGATGQTSGSATGGAGDAGANAGGTASSAGGDAGFAAPTGPQAQRLGQLFADGSTAFGRGDFGAAARAFREAYELSPSPEMAFNLARVYERMGETTEGVRFFQIVLAGNPSPAMRADIEHRIAAMRAYEQRRSEGIAQPPPSTDELSAEGLTWFTRGVTFFRRRQYAQARIAFEQAHAFLQTPELFFNLASTYERLGQIDLAIENLREYLSARRGTAEEAEIQRRIDALQNRR